MYVSAFVIIYRLYLVLDWGTDDGGKVTPDLDKRLIKPIVNMF